MANSEIYTENGSNTDDVPSSHRQKPEFTFTVRDGSSFPQFRLVAICLGLLSALLLVVAIVLGVYCNRVSINHLALHQNLTQLSSELEQLRITHHHKFEYKYYIQRRLHIVNTSFLLEDIELQQQTTRNDNFQTQIESLSKENTQLQIRKSSLEKSCGQCLPKWDLFNSTCYYFAITEDIEPTSWTEARKKCLSHGADLVLIDSWEKQDFINKAIEALRYSSGPWTQTGFWIGLKDDEKEETWKWLDGTELNQGYWAPGEPNDMHNEDCAAVYSKNHPNNNWDAMKTWNDAPCTLPLKWICEMKADH